MVDLVRVPYAVYPDIGTLTKTVTVQLQVQLNLNLCFSIRWLCWLCRSLCLHERDQLHMRSLVELSMLLFNW